MKNIFIIIAFLVFNSCEDKDQGVDVDQSLVSVIATGIIDFQTDAFDVDTMYTHYEILGINVTASYDSGTVNIADMYKSVTPGAYEWSGKGITYSIDTTSFEIVYDTTDVSGEYNLENGDICVLTVSVDETSKIGLTQKICNDER